MVRREGLIALVLLSVSFFLLFFLLFSLGSVTTLAEGYEAFDDYNNFTYNNLVDPYDYALYSALIYVMYNSPFRDVYYDRYLNTLDLLYYLFYLNGMYTDLFGFDSEARYRGAYYEGGYGNHLPRVNYDGRSGWGIYNRALSNWVYYSYYL